MASRGPGDGYAGGCRRVQGPSESLSVGTCAVLAPCLREARSCLVAAWCRGGCCPRGPAPGDLVLLLLATRAPYSLAVLLAARHPTGECGPSPSWAPRWVGAREAEISCSLTMATFASKRTSASAVPQSPQPPATATPPASANPLPPNVSENSRRGPPFRPRILVIASETRKLSSLSPFQRKEGCDRMGRVVRCDKLRDGGVEVEFSSEVDAKRALSATSFTYTVKDKGERREVKLPITVTAHRTKNGSKGVIHCADLEDVDDEEIEDGLADFGVIAARRIKSKRRDGTLTPTHNIILSFNQLDLPKEVVVGYLRVKVRPYIPSPLRCFRCLRFGHTRDYCKGRPTCAKCASNEHDGEECTAQSPRCVNCDETQIPHGAFDRSCPALLREKEILAFKVTNNLSFREARDRYDATHPKRSYANVTKETRPIRHESGPQQGNIDQLMSLLRSFGLTLTGPGVPSGPAASRTPQPSAVLATAETQTSPTRPGEANRSDPDGGWTVVRGRRGSGPSRTATSRPGSVTPPLQSPVTPSEPAGTAVMEALRRGEEERRAREAKRARLAEKARETRHPPGAEGALAMSATPPEPPSAGRAPPMGPPPPPPTLRRPPPPPPKSDAAQPPSVAATAAGKPDERPTKRSLPLEGSPTDGGTPCARQRFRPGSSAGRSSSADSRPRRGHVPIQFGEGTLSGATQYF